MTLLGGVNWSVGQLSCFRDMTPVAIVEVKRSCRRALLATGYQFLMVETFKETRIPVRSARSATGVCNSLCTHIKEKDRKLSE